MLCMTFFSLHASFCKTFSIILLLMIDYILLYINSNMKLLYGSSLSYWYILMFPCLTREYRLFTYIVYVAPSY